MFQITYQAVAAHLAITAMHSFCVKEKNKLQKIHAVFVVKMPSVESVKMEYQYAHVYQAWLEVHRHVDRNVYRAEIAPYSRLVSIKNV